MKKVKDHYFYKAKKENYPARSVYKLEEIDRKYRIIKKGFKILDLGCSPGSWSKYCSEKTGESGKIVCIDIEKIKIEIKPNIYFIQDDIFKIDLNKLKTIESGFDIVLSDMAPKTTGIRDVDQARSLDLVKTAYDIALKTLKTGGHFICKIFQGPETDILIKNVKDNFSWVKAIKPKSTRKESFEVYLVGYSKK